MSSYRVSAKGELGKGIAFFPITSISRSREGTYLILTWIIFQPQVKCDYLRLSLTPVPRDPAKDGAKQARAGEGQDKV